jgi:rubrerythrin
MSLFKKGTCHSSVVISSTVYVCPSCGHTTVIRDNDNCTQECPKCNTRMNMVSSNSKKENDSSSKSV